MSLQINDYFYQLCQPFHPHFTSYIIYTITFIRLQSYSKMATEMHKPVQEPEEYELQDIVDQMQDGKKTLYLVKWKGYSDEYNTWQPRSHLANVPEKLRQWSKTKKARKDKQETNKKAWNASWLGSDLDKNIHKRNEQNSNHSKKKPTQSKLNVNKHPEAKYGHSNSNKLLNHRPQPPSNLSTMVNKKSGHFSTNMQKVKQAKKVLLNIKKQAKKTMTMYEKVERRLNKNLNYIDTTQDKSFDTDIILSSKGSGVSTKQSLSHNKKKVSSPIFQRQKELLKSLQARKIILDKTDVNEDQDLIIIEESGSQNQEIIQQYSDHSNNPQTQQIPDNIDDYVQLQIPQKQKPNQQNQNSQKQPQTNQFENDCNDLFDLHSQKDQQAPILPEDQLQSVTPLPNIAECYDGDNLNIFFEEPVQTITVQERLDYSAMKQILKMFKYEGVVFCQVLNRNGSTFEKIAFQDLREKRPVLICNFFNQQYPGQQLDGSN